MRPEVGFKWHMIMDHLDKDKKMAASTLWAVFQLADRAVAFVTPVVEYWLKSIWHPTAPRAYTLPLNYILLQFQNSFVSSLMLVA